MPPGSHPAGRPSLQRDRAGGATRRIGLAAGFLHEFYHHGLVADQLGAIRNGARRIHRGLNALLIGGLVVQFWAAGWAAFGRPFTVHALLGWSLLAASLLLVIVALVAYGRHRMSAASAALALSLAMQPVFVFVLSSVSIALAALHPVNGLLALGLTLLMEGWSGRRGSSR